MLVKDVVKANNTDLISVHSSFHNDILPVSKNYFIGRYEDDAIWETEVESWSVDEYDGNYDHETILLITI